MDESLLLPLGYAGLFLVSFLAATLVPLSSEGAVALMAVSDFNPALVLVVATAGNSLGALANYYVGKWGGRFLLSRYIKADPKVLAKAERICGRLGGPVLFFAWLPVVGDPLTLAAGVLKMNLWAFLFWVVLGKAFRYWAIIGAVAL
ncbi:MAG: YqaA family protein [Thermodesulfobacteriota bacterium]